MNALGIDLGPLPERPTQPDDPGTADRIHDEAEAEINREARDLNFWIGLFDDAENVDDVDCVALACAMHNAHNGHPEAALDMLREAAECTIAALTAQEVKERLDELDACPDPDFGRDAQQDRLDALREDHQEFLEDR